ncbi:MAG: 23S rRNA (guanosine(2251)-2'-O)-methyltransferase RlmB, partial [Cyanobium sp.]
MSPPPDRRFDPKPDRGRRGPASSRFGSPRPRWSREGSGERSEGRERPDRPRRADRGERPERAERPDRPDRGERRPFSPRRPFRERPSFSRSVPDRDRPAAGGERPAREADGPARRFGRFREGPVRTGRFGMDRRLAAPARPSDRSEEPQPQGEAASHGAESAGDLIWGRHAVLAVLESGRPVHRIWCTSEMRFSPRFMPLLREAKASGVLLEEVTWARLGQISAGGVHQGIVLQPAAAESLDLPTLIEGCRGIGEAPLLVAVDGLTDPQNLGAIVRSAEALGAHGLVLPQCRTAGLTGSVAKVAAGALEHLPVARVVNLNRSLDTLKQEGYRVIGLAGEGTVSLEEADLSGPLVLVTGSEADGLSMLTRRSCDQLVRIPLRGATPSLNAAVATALLLYEVARRGWMRGLSGSAPAPRLVRPSLPAPPAPAPALEHSEPPAASDPELESGTIEPASSEPPQPEPEALPAALRSEEGPLEPPPVDPSAAAEPLAQETALQEEEQQAEEQQEQEQPERLAPAPTHSAAEESTPAPPGPARRPVPAA